MKISILYNKFLDIYGKDQVVGGVETYLDNLAKLCVTLNYDVTIYQWSKTYFENKNNGYLIKGIPLFDTKKNTRNRKLFNYVESEINLSKDVIIFGADHVSVPTINDKHISIQHGISWDLPVEFMSTRKLVKYGVFSNLLKKRAVNYYKKCFENCLNTVCVDYNFLNWYRTTVPSIPENYNTWVIPNFSNIASHKIIENRSYKNNKISILFARRFVKMRGTNNFAEVLKILLDKYSNIECTLAGEGPEESYLRAMFFNEERVSFIKYYPDQSLDVHLRHDIAVIPSLASEGTSLSVAEAMAAGCSVVATAVGGITNMIIDGYNGILTSPNTSSLRDGIERLLDNSQLRRDISIRAYDTAKNAFSMEKWQHSWKKVLEEVACD